MTDKRVQHTFCFGISLPSKFPSDFFLSLCIFHHILAQYYFFIKLPTFFIFCYTFLTVFFSPAISFSTIKVFSISNHLRTHYAWWSNIITIIIHNNVFKWNFFTIWFSFTYYYYDDIHIVYINWFFISIKYASNFSHSLLYYTQKVFFIFHNILISVLSICSFYLIFPLWKSLCTHFLLFLLIIVD